MTAATDFAHNSCIKIPAAQRKTGVTSCSFVRSMKKDHCQCVTFILTQNLCSEARSYKQSGFCFQWREYRTIRYYDDSSRNYSVRLMTVQTHTPDDVIRFKPTKSLVRLNGGFGPPMQSRKGPPSNFVRPRGSSMATTGWQGWHTLANTVALSWRKNPRINIIPHFLGVIIVKFFKL